MRKTTLLLLLLLLIPALACAQIELGPFVFLDKNKASNVTVDAVIGSGGLSGSVSAETPAPGVLSFLDFIPGYATRYMVTIGGGGLYGEATVIARARYQPKRKAIGFLGLGPGLGVSIKDAFKITPTISVVVGLDYLINDKYLVSVVVRSVGLLTIGFGMHKGYGW
jgi:hypothetical protein